jgi:hypothetical protein
MLWSLWCRSPDLSGSSSDGWQRWCHQHTEANRSRLLTRAAGLAKTYPDHQFTVTAAEPREWSPLVQRTEKPAQGWLPFSDGSHLGPLFNLPG